MDFVPLLILSEIPASTHNGMLYAGKSADALRLKYLASMRDFLGRGDMA